MSSIAKKDLETVIGLEVHLQFSTLTKIFCGCANIFGEDPNTRTCPVCLGLPGTLPVLNQQVLRSGIKAGCALNCEINSFIKFDRKNYYYPDLPKGYQISQYDYPIAKNGFIMIPTQDGTKKIRILRAHLEEDAGKLIHENESKCSLVDYNRTGTPLLEIVSEPDLRSAQEAYDYLTTLKLILQYLNISDCDMEKGSLRCDANISVRKIGDPTLGTKAEIKNLNSFKAVKAGLEFEENRQKTLWIAGEKIIQETRLWNEDKGMTISMRTKEAAHDYRYFPEPDLVPFMVEQSQIEEIRASLPELPDKKLERFQAEYKLSRYDSQLLIQDSALADYFEACVQLYPQAKKICNWLSGPILQEVNNRKTSLKDLALPPEHLTNLILKVEKGVVSNLAAKDVLRLMLDTHQDPDAIIKKEGLAQVSDAGSLEKIIEEVIKENPKAVKDVAAGKENVLGFLVGQTMKKSKGKANPKKVGDLIKRRLLNA